jgi:methylated-DNA-[protein]-cysteine S-methyltransferase
LTNGVSGLLVGLVATPWGEVAVSVRNGRLAGIDLPAWPVGGSASRVADATPIGAAAPGDRAVLERWVKELEAYFHGERLSWSAEEVGIDEMAVSPFARAVYDTLLSISPAVTVSYGVLAEMAGYPRAARAVGAAMATNPVPIVIPCHRVIRSDGSLGRYGNDPAWKERLLAHERNHADRPVGGR